jgi:putative component of toxin-antitoxin plasmid stabilization module
MTQVKQTEIFKTWFARLRDKQAKRAITNRIGRMTHGLFGDS